MLEMRMVLCYCVQQFDFELAGDLVKDPGRWDRDLKDIFVVLRGELPVKVKDRIVKQSQ